MSQTRTTGASDPGAALPLGGGAGRAHELHRLTEQGVLRVPARQATTA